MKRLFTTLPLILLPFFLSAQPVDFSSLLSEVDRRTTFVDGDFTATLDFVSQDPQAGTTRRKVTQFRRDSEDKFLVLILAPEAQKGQGTLRIDTNVWAYDPESRKFAHSSLKDGFGGTDTRNSDFRKSSWASDYRVKSGADGKVGALDAWVLDLEATNNEVSFQTVRLWVSKTIRPPLKAEGYSVSGRLLRTTYYYSWTKIADQSYPSKLQFVDALTKGQQTEVTLSNMSREALPDEVFTKGFLERVNR